MSIKNKAVNDKLKAKLKENKKRVLKEEEFEEDDDFSGDDNTDVDGLSDGDLGSDDDFSQEGMDDEFGGEEDLDTELSPEQEEFVDTEIDTLLQPAADELGREEEDSLGNEDTLEESEDLMTEDEDFNFEDEGDEFEGEDDLGIETSGDELGDIEGEEDVDSVFSAEELQNIINSPDTIDQIDNDLATTAVDEVPAEGGDDFDGDDDGFGELGSDDDSLMAEAELDEEINNEMKLHEAEIAGTVKSLKFEKDDTDLEGTFSKVTKPTGKDGVAKHSAPGSLKDMKQEIKEAEVKKSKMLVKLAKQVLALQKKEKELQLENYKLMKANGLLAAAGEKLDSASRIKIVESFSKCKNAANVNQLYSKVVKIIKDKSRGSINEAVQNRTRSTKSIGRINEGKEDTLTKEQVRANLLMGIHGSDEAYFSQF